MITITTDRIYKKVQNSNGSSAGTYYLRDASGKREKLITGKKSINKNRSL